MSEANKQQGAVQTTGHSWDGDLQEFNNPLPTWWLWGFYLTVIFAVIYWVIYPAWPVGESYTKGVANTITYTVNGEERTTHWNTRALLMKEMQSGQDAQKMQAYMEKVAAASYDDILADEEMLAFTRAVAKGLFGDNCAACHGSGGAGVMGLFPNLVDDAWLWGGTVEQIETTLTEGRHGFMPAFGRSLDDGQIDAVAHYVLSLSGHEVDGDMAQRGMQIFNGKEGGCFYCHTQAGTGLESQGAANLTDSIWTVANVPGQDSLEGKLAEVREVVENGIERVMPAWDERLSDNEIKLLTVYVHELGGGQ
ncbi:Cbb3-type cytochrome c oxidase subunit FixP [Thiohalobacter sp. COW1]|uniref:Cbb3-type cytochrome c oxidase subunit n=2 Tax=Thiohalobacteraceae TaxID=3085110 RepID=A0A1Z4VLF9_9GAMM|nr:MULTISPECIES: cytochrome-c oxidase, cbb3-type subunit III [Thiohalobacter]BAZ92427.1 cbb3-type cytochrome c oxidase subunit [Thiohalobacter thiocyanaticus]BCO32588.1 Cbb3-type cytochrome c oxidase subunit FixP [Thiohalobacter sp. COW1]